MKKKLKILIVDDDPHILRLYEEELKEEGYGVVTAGTGQEALELFEKENPDIVVLDILMPDIDGKSLLKKMKDQQLQTPVIISTAYDYQDDFEDWASRADAYVVKSSDPSELKRAIKKII